MLAKTISPYVEVIRNKYPQFDIVESLPLSIKPEEVERVIYSNDTVEIMYKRNKKICVAILEQGQGQRALIRLKKQIATRKDPNERYELWECRCPQGFYDMSIEYRLIESRMTESEKETESRVSA